MRTAALALLALACGAAGGEVRFHSLAVGNAAANGIFAADLDGDGTRDLVALGSRYITVLRGRRGDGAPYAQEPEVIDTKPQMDRATGRPLWPPAYFVDVADVLPLDEQTGEGQGLELLVLTPVGVWCFVQRQGAYQARPRELLPCDTLLTAGPARGVVSLAALRSDLDLLPWNFAFDVDGDGLDDLVVAHGGGTDVARQRPAAGGGVSGEFHPPQTLELLPVLGHAAASEGKADGLTAPRSLQARTAFAVPRLERVDVDEDGRADLATDYLWFRHKPEGGFETSPRSRRRSRPTGGTVVDVDGDGRQDYIRAVTTMEDLFNFITRVRVHLANEDGTLPRVPTDTVVSQNVLIYQDLPIHDFDGDGSVDFAMFKTDITVTEIAKWFRQNLGRIEGSLNFFLFDRAERRYPRGASFSMPIELSFKLDLTESMRGAIWEPRYLGTMVRFEGDYNADGRPDLFIRQETNAIALYFNTGGERLYARRPDVLLREVPMFGDLTLDDLNGDGATDLILLAGSAGFAPVGNPDRVVAVYISQLE
ncbi:MAG: FG-GAP repeat domain-containing protein [Candidatus Brocadiia bacterium]